MLKNNPDRCYLVRATWRGEPVRFRCDADDWNHAAEQALDAYPGAVVTGIERGSS